MAKTLALIHTSPLVIPVFGGLCRKTMPQVELFHMLDESLLKNTLAEGRLSETTVRRLVEFVRSAHEGGADAVLVTCSSIGPAVDAARQAVKIPVLRVDEAMADQAVGSATRIGVAATLKSTLDPTVNLLKQRAALRKRECEIAACLCEGAFEAVAAGDTEKHNRIVREKLIDLMDQVDAIVLAQASMARVVETIPSDQRRVPILSSPESAVEQARKTMDGIAS